MKKIEFLITNPVNINELFHLPPDTTEWKTLEYVKNKSGYDIPKREKVFTQSQVLLPKEKFQSFFSKNSKYNYGIYLLFFKDFGKFYVGITAKYSKLVKNLIIKQIKSPEGFLTRLRKHRAKCTGTDINIMHTASEWQPFAKERYKKIGPGDTMDDCYLSFIIFKNHENEKENDKGKLEYLENKINCDLEKFEIFKDFSQFKSLAKTNRTDIEDYNPKFKNININELV